MGKVKQIEVEADEINTVKDMFLAFKPVINQIALSQNDACSMLHQHDKEIDDVRMVAGRADQRSKTNRWLITGIVGGLITIASVLIKVMAEYLGG